MFFIRVYVKIKGINDIFPMSLDRAQMYHLEIGVPENDVKILFH